VTFPLWAKARQSPRHFFMTQLKSKLFLWNGSGLYAGFGLDSDMHKHTAVQLGFSLGEPFRIEYPDKSDYDACYIFLIKPGLPHKILAAETPAFFLWIEPESRLGHQLLRLPSNCIPNRLAIEQITVMTTPDKLRSCEQAKFLFHQLISYVLPTYFETNGSSTTLDDRVVRVIDYIKEERTFSRTASITQLAERVHLSSSRLRHIFNQHMDISLKQYILWHRLLNSLEIVLKTDSLTQAAYESGFADAAHMSRTFHQTFGLKPSQVLKNSQFIQAISCLDC
jgi:AraC-like DNA-binding protein